MVLAAGPAAQDRSAHRRARLRDLHPGADRRGDAIALGSSDVAIAGGTESMSDAPIFTSRAARARAGRGVAGAQHCREKLRPFQKLKPKDLLPVPPAIAEYSTGMTMGESAEKMAKENGITREEQDEIALASHQQRRARVEGRHVRRPR